METLLKESLGAVYRFCLRLTRDENQALDLTQETVLRAWRSRSALDNPASARTWLFRIASNAWKDQIRKKAREPESLNALPLGSLPPPAMQLEQNEAVDLALAALDRLPERQRQVMYLVTIEQLDRCEVADVLGITTEAVKANLSAARKQLREQLRPLYEEYCSTGTCSQERR